MIFFWVPRYWLTRCRSLALFFISGIWSPCGVSYFGTNRCVLQTALGGSYGMNRGQLRRGSTLAASAGPRESAAGARGPGARHPAGAGPRPAGLQRRAGGVRAAPRPVLRRRLHPARRRRRAAPRGLPAALGALPSCRGGGVPLEAERGEAAAAGCGATTGGVATAAAGRGCHRGPMLPPPWPHLPRPPPLMNAPGLMGLGCRWFGSHFGCGHVAVWSAASRARP